MSCVLAGARRKHENAMWTKKNAKWNIESDVNVKRTWRAQEKNQEKWTFLFSWSNEMRKGRDGRKQKKNGGESMAGARPFLQMAAINRRNFV